MMMPTLQLKSLLFGGASWFGKFFSRLPLVTLSLASLSVALFFIFGPAVDGLVYQQEAVLQGNLTQLLSAHFVHTDGGHLIWNSAALIVLGGLLEVRQGASVMLAYLVLGMVSVDLYVLNQPSLVAYCGLSGVLNTLLIGVLASLYRDQSMRLIAIMVGLASLGKIMVEIMAGQALLTHTVWPSVPLAHLAGFAGGLLALVLLHYKSEYFTAVRSAITQTKIHQAATH